MKMEISIEDRVVVWAIIKKLKGIELFDFSECIKDIGLDSYNKYHIEKIDKGLEKYNNRINQFVISYFEENN